MSWRRYFIPNRVLYPITLEAVKEAFDMAQGQRAIDPGAAAILKELSAALRARYGDRFYGLHLYGSQARGEATPSSDMDLLLILGETEKPSREIDRIVDILADFNLRYGVLLSVLPVSQQQFQKAEGPFWRNVRREGIAA